MQACMLLRLPLPSYLSFIPSPALHAADFGTQRPQTKHEEVEIPSSLSFPPALLPPNLIP